MAQPTNSEGHRTRLRQHFLSSANTLSASQLLELLLTYAIARRDVSPVAQALMERFGSIDGVFGASYDELLGVSGVGEQTATLIALVGQFAKRDTLQATQQPVTTLQPSLFEIQAAQSTRSEEGVEPPDPASARQPEIRTFANDEIAN